MQETQAPQATRKRKQAREIAPSSVVVPFKRACEEAGIAYKTGRRAVFFGEIPIIKFGRNWYIRRSEIERFLEANTKRYGQ